MIDQKWMETCINAGELLYGEFPMSIFHRLYETRCPKMTTEEVMEYYDESLMMLCDGEMFTPLMATEGEILRVFKDADAAGNPYASLHFDLNELKALRKEQSLPGLEYWIPTAKQIGELVENGYIRTKEMTALEKEIMRLGGDPAFIPKMWASVSTGRMDMNDAVNEGMKEISAAYGDAEHGAPTLDQLNGSLRYLNEFLNMVNMRERKGWPPKELFRKMHPNGLTSMPTIVPGSARAARSIKEAEPQLRAMGANVDYSSIDSFATIGAYGERRVIKVGRNDPCPCGSGKKYKQCHGRNL